jgi:hypothetical protein
MSCRAGHRSAALLGLFAVLFQAVLFGWHHHDLVFSGGEPHAFVRDTGSPTQPADDEEGCEICQVLHHQTASAGDDIVAPVPGPAASPSIAVDPAFAVYPLALAFHARAPPLA